jgi:hypothetical protein
MAFVLARLMSIMQNYADAVDPAEKEYKRATIYRMIEKHHLMYDNRVITALNRYNLPIPELALYE